MGTTGIIRPEFRQPLVDLRNRLGVSEEAANKLFLEAAEERMIPMVEWIVLELERTMLTAEQLAQKRQIDYGEDYFKSGKGASVSLTLYFSSHTSLYWLYLRFFVYLIFILLIFSTGNSWTWRRGKYHD